MVNGRKKILIIGNGDAVSRAVESALQEFADVKTVTAGFNVAECLGEEYFDVIILDLDFKNGDCLKILSEIKSRCRTQVLGMFDACPPERLKKAIDIGLADYFIKSAAAVGGIADFVKKFLEEK